MFTYQNTDIVVEVRRKGGLWQDHSELPEAIRSLQLRIECCECDVGHGVSIRCRALRQTCLRN